MSADQPGHKPAESLFDVQPNQAAAAFPAVAPARAESPKRRPTRADVRAIQDLLWKEALLAVQELQPGDDEERFKAHLREHLPQNSESTRSRYAQNLIRWFFSDGISGLAARVWLAYRDPALTVEALRYLYLRAEPMVGRVVADALFPIADNAVVPASYIDGFVRQAFGADTPDKSLKRVRLNLRKLGFLSRERGNRDTLRPLNPSATGFMLVTHYLYANGESRGVEFRNIADDTYWRYLGFKSEDRLRAILRDAVARGTLAKYVVADRIESISFTLSFDEFVQQGVRL